MPIFKSTTTIVLAAVLNAQPAVSSDKCFSYLTPILGGNQCGPTDDEDISGYFIADKASFSVYNSQCLWGRCVPTKKQGANEVDFTPTCFDHDACYDEIGECPVDCDAKAKACNDAFYNDLDSVCNGLPHDCQQNKCKSSFRDVYHAGVVFAAPHYMGLFGCEQATEVTYSVYHNQPDLCSSDGIALIETIYKGATYGVDTSPYGLSTKIRWNSMSTPNGTGDCSWDRSSDKTTSWFDNFLGQCGIAPSKVKLPADSNGMATHHVEYIVEHQLPTLCSDGTKTVQTRYIGEKCRNNKIRWTSMKTINPVQGKTPAECSWTRHEHAGDSDWLESWIGTGCGDSPTELALPTSV